MTKEEVLSIIETKIRLKASSEHFINDVYRCVSDALKLDLPSSQLEEIKKLKTRLENIDIPHSSRFELWYNEPVLNVIIELEQMLQD